jgi:hypothetical protein
MADATQKEIFNCFIDFSCTAGGREFGQEISEAGLVCHFRKYDSDREVGYDAGTAKMVVRKLNEQDYKTLGYLQGVVWASMRNS